MTLTVEMHVHLSLAWSSDFAQVTIKLVKIWVNCRFVCYSRILTSLMLIIIILTADRCYLQYHSDTVAAIG